ncbi:RcnB family protein [Massilia sp. B-10]|nr:RcnB family protein [Massilia sp. B-10]
MVITTVTACRCAVANACQRDYGSYYVVNDWNRHNRLYAPQRGYQWVQVGGDYALVAIATGIIAHVLLNN